MNKLIIFVSSIIILSSVCVHFIFGLYIPEICSNPNIIHVPVCNLIKYHTTIPRIILGSLLSFLYHIITVIILASLLPIIIAIISVSILSLLLIIISVIIMLAFPFYILYYFYNINKKRFSDFYEIV